MVCIRTRINNVADRLTCDLFNSSEDRFRFCCGARIDNHHAVHSGLDSDIPSAARDHIEVLSKLKHLEVGPRVRNLLREQSGERYDRGKKAENHWRHRTATL